MQPAFMRILIIDNYDSFTYNLYHLVEAVMPQHWTLEVRRNDDISLEAAGKYDKFIISPGPGLPSDAGISCALIEHYAHRKSILGVCLGHQAIAQVFEGKLLNLPAVLHGVAIQTRVVDKDDLLFAGCPDTFKTGRYHSWVVDPVHFPSCLAVTATDEMGLIMAFKHREFDVWGVQFHPESIMTETGRKILDNWTAFIPGSKPF